MFTSAWASHQKFRVSNTIGFIKGENAMRIHRELFGSKKKDRIEFLGKRHCASTMRLDEETIKEYFREQD